MSNPLSMFRKHQYIFLVVFGVMLMVAFIVLPPLDDYLRTQPGPGGGNAVVVSWKGGKLSASELERQRLMHRVAVSFLYAVVDETQRREGTPRGVRQGQFGQILDPGIPSTMSDENLVHTHLLATKGEKMGMVVSDEAIVEFLEQLSDDKIQGNEMGVIFKENLGSQFTIQQLLNQLRTELMAQRVRSMAEAGLYVAPYGTVQPVQAWDYFKRLNRRVKIEAVALNVDDYVDRVKDPSDAQLEELYNEGKNRLSFPESPEPGFQKRRRAAFQYVRADLNKFIEEEKAKLTITDEEIEKHYEENKAVRYRAIDLPDATLDSDATPDEGTEKPAATDPAGDAAPAPPTDDPAPAPPSDESTKKKDPAENPASETPNEKPAVDPAPEDPQPAEPKGAEPKDTEPKDTEPKDAEPTDTEPTDTEPTDTEPTDTEPKDAEPEPATETPAPSAPGEANVSAATREFFVSTPGEENQPPAEAPAAESDPPPAPADPPAASGTADPPPAEPAASQEEPADPQPADPKPAEPADPKPEDPKPVEPAEPADPNPADPQPEDPKPESTTPSETPPAEKPAEDPAATSATDPASATSATEEEPPKVRPLDDKLRQEIRDELADVQARQPAQERIDKALAELRNLVTKLGRAKRAELRKANPDDHEAEPVGPVDVDELAATHGVAVGQIELVDSIGVVEHELGRSFNMQFTSWPPTRENFTEIAFLDNVRRFSPTLISGSESGVQFLYWTTDGAEPFVPDFKEVRPDVLAVWKRIEARKIALNEAKNLKDELEKSGQTLAEKFADAEREVIAPPDFSWMTTGFNPGGAGTPVLSDVVGIESAGPDFMKEVFALETGKIAAALNGPQSTVYLVRLVSDSPPENLLKQLFLSSGDSPEVQHIAYVESISLLRAWYANLETEMDVTWNREPIDAT